MSRFQRRVLHERRVVITGIGCVSPLGLTAIETWKNAIEGKSGISKITLFDASKMDSQIAGEVKGFNPENWIPKKEIKKMDRFIQLSIAASKMAMEDSGLQINELNAQRVGAFIGAGMGGLPAIENQHSLYLERGPGRISPFFIPMVIANLASGWITIETGAKGPSYCNTSACSSGAHAIGEAFNYIRYGKCDAMISGGGESVVCPMAIGGFSAMRALSTRNDQPESASRPWDKNRDGFVLAEGSAILILEELEHAEKRGAKIYAEVRGYGATSDAYHITSPDQSSDGPARAMILAVEDGQLNRNDIQYINAHGTSTPVGDPLEVNAIKKVFGDKPKHLAVSSTKSMTGHLLGAAGAIESMFTALAIKDQILPPTINLENPSDNCDLDFVPLTARSTKIQHALNNSFGFGGVNACLLLSKLE